MRPFDRLVRRTQRWYQANLDSIKWPSTPAAPPTGQCQRDMAVTLGATSLWTMGESSGDLVDIIAGLNLTVTGTITRDVVNAQLASDDGAVAFPSAGNYASRADHANFDLGDTNWTITVWLRRDTDTGNFEIALSKGTNAYAIGFAGSTGTIPDALVLTKDNVAEIASTSAAVAADGAWHWYAVVRIGTGAGNTKIYKDGSDVTNLINSATSFADTADALEVGRDGAGDPPFLGGMDELTFYKGIALSAQNIADLWDSRSNPCSVAFDPADGFNWQEQPADWRPVRWFAPDLEHSRYPDPTLGGLAPFDASLSAWLHDEVQQYKSTERPWVISADLLGLREVPETPNPAYYQEQPQEWRPVRWFTPDLPGEGEPPLPNAYTGFGLQEQPAAWQTVRWFTPDAETSVIQPPAPPAFDPATLPHGEDAQQLRPSVQAWAITSELVGLREVAPETGIGWYNDEVQQFRSTAAPWVLTADLVGLRELGDAAPTAPILAEQPAFWQAQHWFAPEASVEGFEPRPNAATHPDFGWDAGQDRSIQPVWRHPDMEWHPTATGGFPPELLAALWPDQSGQQDRSIQPVWHQPDPDVVGLAPSLVTTATVEQQAALWPEQPFAWQARHAIDDAIAASAMTINPNLYTPAPGATPKVLIDATTGDVYLYIGSNFIVPAS